MPLRPSQSIPAEIIADLLSAIRHQFYPDASPKHWAQDSHFLKIRVIMWPAAWLTKRGVTLPPARYKQIILEVLNEVKIHGATDQIKFWPGYLLKCLQQHFKHNEQKYYDEAKAIRTLAESALHAATRLPPGSCPLPPAIDPITALAYARQDLLRAQKSRRKTKAPTPTQPDLFSL